MNDMYFVIYQVWDKRVAIWCQVSVICVVNLTDMNNIDMTM